MSQPCSQPRVGPDIFTADDTKDLKGRANATIATLSQSEDNEATNEVAPLLVRVLEKLDAQNKAQKETQDELEKLKRKQEEAPTKSEMNEVREMANTGLIHLTNDMRNLELAVILNVSSM